jgi:ferredoxin-thioredoxin reductase catalytic subunit
MGLTRKVLGAEHDEHKEAAAPCGQMATDGDCYCVLHSRASLQGPVELAQGLSHETGTVGILPATDGRRALEHLP